MRPRISSIDSRAGASRSVVIFSLKLASRKASTTITAAYHHNSPRESGLPLPLAAAMAHPKMPGFKNFPRWQIGGAAGRRSGLPAVGDLNNPAQIHPLNRTHLR
jgi:hypothetical protein